MARELNVIGLMNVQMAVQGEDVFVIEVNPRARERFLCLRASAFRLAKVAARCIRNDLWVEQGVTHERIHLLV